MSAQGILTSISKYPDQAYAGLREGLDAGDGVISLLNNAGTTAGVYDLSFTAVNSTLYTANVYGVHLSYTSDGSATLAEIRDGILASAAAQPGLILKASFAASSNNVRITELDPAGNGPALVGGLDANTAVAVVTAHAEPEGVPAGVLVMRGSTYQQGRLFRAADGTAAALVKKMGITAHSHMYAAPRVSTSTSASTVNYPANSQMSVVNRGRIWCVCETVMALDDTVYARFITGAGGTQLGAFRNTSDSSTCLSLAGLVEVRKVSIGSAGSVALLKINLTP